MPRDPIADDGGEFAGLESKTAVLPRRNPKRILVQTNLGAVIAQLQVPAIIEATVGKNAADPKTALALIKFLQGPAIDQSLKDYGMEKGEIGK